MLLNEDMLNEHVNEMTGCHPGISVQIPPARRKQLCPLPTPATVEPTHPRSHHQWAKLEEGQKGQAAHVLGWRLPFGKVNFSVGSCMQVQIKTGEQLGGPCCMCWGKRLRKRVKEAAQIGARRGGGSRGGTDGWGIKRSGLDWGLTSDSGGQR